MSNKKPLLSNPRAVRFRAMRDVFGVPGLGMFLSMAGFSAIAREAGFGLFEALATTALVWGMPGQVAMASLYLAGASVAVIFIAVALANMRMMLMVVSTVDLLGFRRNGVGLPKQLLSVHLLAITTWLQLAVARGAIAREAMYIYFLSFSVLLYIVGLCGTILGYFLVDLASIWLLKVIIFTTPLYILMMVTRVRDLLFRQAGLVGGIVAPLLYPVLGGWSILLAGVVGGSLVMLPRFISARRLRSRLRERGRG